VRLFPLALPYAALGFARWRPRPAPLQRCGADGWGFGFGFFLVALIDRLRLPRRCGTAWLMPFAWCCRPRSRCFRCRAAVAGCRRPASRVFLLRGLHVAEWLRGHILTGFWNLPGYGWSAS
jgi:apolipoprotein N-acyltransferase